MNVLVPSFAEDALRLHQFENGDAELGEHQLRVTFNQSRGIGYHVISPEADAAIEEEIQNVAQKVMGFLSKQASKTIDWMDVGLDGKNQLSVEFGGEQLESESLLNKFKTLRLTNTEFQQETNNLMELLQKLHTNGKPFSIRIASLS